MSTTFGFLDSRRPSGVKKHLILREDGGKQLILERMLEWGNSVSQALSTQLCFTITNSRMLEKKDSMGYLEIPRQTPQESQENQLT